MSPSPAREFFHPLPILALVVLGVNDHLLKGWAPGWITGKLSDFAGLFYFPLLLTATWDTLSTLAGRPARLTRQKLIVAMVLTGTAFSLLKCSQWVAAMAAQAMTCLGLPERIPITDPTDLVALSSLVGTWLHGRRFLEPPGTEGSTPPGAGH